MTGNHQSLRCSPHPNWTLNCAFVNCDVERGPQREVFIKALAEVERRIGTDGVPHPHGGNTLLGEGECDLVTLTRIKDCRSDGRCPPEHLPQQIGCKELARAVAAFEEQSGHRLPLAAMADEVKHVRFTSLQLGSQCIPLGMAQHGDVDQPVVAQRAERVLNAGHFTDRVNQRQIVWFGMQIRMRMGREISRAGGAATSTYRLNGVARPELSHSLREPS